MAQQEEKKWWQSRTIIISLVALVFFGYRLFLNWTVVELSEAQLQAAREISANLVGALEAAKDGNWTNLAGFVWSIVIIYLRFITSSRIVRRLA
jgi:hypothetical protein